MPLNPSSSSNLEQLALKGLKPMPAQLYLFVKLLLTILIYDFRLEFYALGSQ